MDDEQRSVPPAIDPPRVALLALALGASAARADQLLYLGAGVSQNQLNDNGTDFAWGVGAQVHMGNIGARPEYEHFNIANTNGAQVFSLDAVIGLL
jgi:hypothetical protein